MFEPPRTRGVPNGIGCQPSGKPNEWSIHCIFVRDGFRGQGVSTDLIRAAIDCAKANGASLISAFPIPSENRKRFPVNEAEFSGRFSTYSKMGFRPVGESSDFYQRMELD
ncbi:MAG: GNAT family N-acetyltransferase [Bdellovibrionales bacterium]|nr:GNAT family N-acetyltransferase [Bdellovibrionales bacterium]